MDFETPKVGIWVFQKSDILNSQNYDKYFKFSKKVKESTINFHRSIEKVQESTINVHSSIEKVKESTTNIIHHHRTVPGGDPEALEHHFPVKTVLVFFCQSVTSADIREPPNGFQ